LRLRDRNSFAPLIVETLAAHPEGTTVRGHMRMPLSVTLFMLGWSTLVLPFALVSLHSFQTQPAFALAPLTMLAGGVAVVCGGFGSGSVRAERLLREIAQAPEAADKRPRG
jgi:hypothetical protein